MLLKMSATDLELLQQFARDQSQDAFNDLVQRHVNLVYSAALRQVRSPHLAEEAAQSAFCQLARHAHTLAHSPNTVLTAWLYQVTRNAAIDLTRSEARRQAREQIAFQMSAIHHPDADWKQIEPLLDEAMNTLDEPDRTALLLRYFENQSLREVGQRLGTSDDAAQKRVSRALDKLRAYFEAQKLSIGTTSLVALVSSHAVQAAPVGLAASLAAHAVLTTATATATATTLTLSAPTSALASNTLALAMTTTQKAILTTAVVGALATGIYQAREISHLREKVQTLTRQNSDSAALAQRLKQAELDRDQAKAQPTSSSAQNQSPSQPASKNPNELHKLRGEVGRLRQEKAEIGASSSLSKVTANPEARKMLRDQQKIGMSMMYAGFASQAKLTPDQSTKLNDLLADHIMANVGHVTDMLRDKPGVDQIDEIFGAQEKALQEKVHELLGEDAQAQYLDYTKNLLNTLTTEQFKGQLTGTKEEKSAKAQQLSQWMKEESQAALTRAGLPEDYQLVPMLNFRNIASEQEAEKSLKLLDEIYSNLATRSQSLLSPQELTKLAEFKAAAIKNNQGALALNRTMMEPIAPKP